VSSNSGYARNMATPASAPVSLAVYLSAALQVST
jgi:hypothetical protein